VKFKFWLSLIGIFILGILLRFVYLGSLPFPINGDEAAHGYNAWSIAHFGTDEFGNSFPIYFPSAGDYKYPVYNYLSAPLVAIFGMNDFMTRFLSALSGVLLIGVVYKLTELLTNERRTALIAALFTAISPWSLIYSRTASLSNLALLLATGGIYFVVSAILDTKNLTKKLLIAGIIFLVAIFTHQSARVFIPGFLGLLLIYIGFNRTQKEFAESWKKILIFGVVVIAVTGVSLIPWESRARAEGLSVFNNSATREKLMSETAREMGLGDPVPPIVTRIFFNKLTLLGWEIGGRYLSHFSPNYLFIQGDIVQLNSVPNMGVLYVLDGLFLLIGLALFITKPTFPRMILLFILLASPLPASASIETPSAQRQVIGLAGFVITAAIGLSFLLDNLKNKGYLKHLVIFLIAGGYLYLFSFFLVNFFKVKAVHQPYGSDQGYQEMVDYVWQEKGNYQKVVMPVSPYMHFLYRKQISPQDFLSRAEIIPTSVQQWDRVKSLDNIIFNMQGNCPKIGRENILYVCNGLEIPRSAKVLKVVRFGDLIPAFTMLTFEAMPVEKQGKSELPFMLNP
jgi:4-amino-4-deoxy-L-arabinose transferase-like glycosyltransferase